jgi:hypothetical protein
MNGKVPSEYVYVEMKNLREELRGLKQCQITFMGLAFSATGLIFGLVKTAQDTKCSALVLLAPLVIIFPTFAFFFDKAKTITRIVGYYRHLEGISLGDVIPKAFDGWENSLAVFREVEDRLKNEAVAEHPCPRPKFLQEVRLRKPFVYWSLAYLTFTSVAVLCPIVASLICKGGLERGISIAILLPVIWVVFKEFQALRSLTTGRDSYTVNFAVWQKIIVEGRKQCRDHVRRKIPSA